MPVYLNGQLVIADNALVTGDVVLLGGGNIETVANNDLTLLPNGTGITIVGDAGSTSHGLTANDDLFVAGKFEVDGSLFADGAIQVAGAVFMASNQDLKVDNSFGVIQMRNTSQTPDAPMLLTGSAGNLWILAEYADRTVDFAHALQTNPTLFIQSADATDITQWFSACHDQTDAVLGSGAGNLKLDPAGDGVDIQGRLLESQGNDVASANDITLGTDGSYFDITGTTQINRIASAGWSAGARFMLQFDGVVTVKDAQAAGGGFASILIDGSTDYVSAAGSILECVFDGTSFKCAPFFSE